MNDRERFLRVMDYGRFDRVPNHELGVWPQTVQRWLGEGMAEGCMHFNWFVSEDFIGLDRREYIPVNFSMIPPFETEVLEKTDRYEVIRKGNGVVTKALVEGTVGGGRMCMDQYLRFPVETPEDFRDLKKRYIASDHRRYPANWKTQMLPAWRDRDYVLVLGHNCAACGFYWRAREWMGTENLSYAWYDQPELMHEMMEFYADFTIECAKPVLQKIDVEYFTFNEDLSMKNGPLLSPDTYRTFIYPHLRRIIEFLKSKGVKYVAVDTDGNPGGIIPLMMDAGVDILWPLERAADMDPVRLRKQYGRDLRLWGGVDKRELAKDRKAIESHLMSMAALVDEGGFIPTVDHTVPPDVSWDNFQYYMECKHKLLNGTLTAS